MLVTILLNIIVSCIGESKDAAGGRRGDSVQTEPAKNLCLNYFHVGFLGLNASLLFLQEFDKKYNPTWHCIVGRNFGSYVTHETKHFIYFYLGQVAILLFKSG